MNTWVVFSQLNFVPNNYIEVIKPLAECHHVKGFVVLKNRSFSLLLKGLFFIMSGLAPRIGYHLVKNYFSSIFDAREKCIRAQKKDIFYFGSINETAFADLVRQNQVDLLVNARTRDIYKSAILNAPKIGAINIHHGLLPHQRGVLCDMWALAKGQDAGFSIHKMSQKLDDGEIIKVVTVSPQKSEDTFSRHLYRSSKIEGQKLLETIAEIAQTKTLSGQPNIKSADTLYFRNPKIKDLIHFKKIGLKL